MRERNPSVEFPSGSSIDEPLRGVHASERTLEQAEINKKTSQSTLEEFDPGSERTLTAGFRHASRARKPSGEYSGVRVRNR